MIKRDKQQNILLLSRVTQAHALWWWRLALAGIASESRHIQILGKLTLRETEIIPAVGSSTPTESMLVLIAKLGDLSLQLLREHLHMKKGGVSAWKTKKE